MRYVHPKIREALDRSEYKRALTLALEGAAIVYFAAAVFCLALWAL